MSSTIIKIIALALMVELAFCKIDCPVEMAFKNYYPAGKCMECRCVPEIKLPPIGDETEDIVVPAQETCSRCPEPMFQCASGQHERVYPDADFPQCCHMKCKK
ncbi:hypothetical protein Ahia01_000818100 [Argonauta hians]